MKTPIHDPTLHFGLCEGSVLPADYLNPPDDPKGNPTLDATLFCPLMAGRSATDADKLLVHRTAKGAPWHVIRTEFSEFERKCHRDISQAEVRKMAGLS